MTELEEIKEEAYKEAITELKNENKDNPAFLKKIDELVEEKGGKKDERGISSISKKKS